MSAFKSDHNLVRDYIVAQDHLQYSLLPEDVVCIHMTHSNLPAKHLDIRLNLHMTVSFIIITHFFLLLLVVSSSLYTNLYHKTSLYHFSFK